MTDGATDATPLWTVVANMTHVARNGRDPERLYTGTPIFSAGTRLHLGSAYWGMSEKLHVIGRGRGSSRMVNAVVGFALLEHVRAKLVYSPARLASLRRLEAFLTPDRDTAEHFADQVTGVIKRLSQERADETIQDAR